MAQQDTPLPDARPPGGLPKAEFVVLIASMMALNALAIDIMVPALNEIGASFQLATANDQQLVIFAYVLGFGACLLYTSPSPRDQRGSRMPSSA